MQDTCTCYFESDIESTSNLRNVILHGDVIDVSLDMTEYTSSGVIAPCSHCRCQGGEEAGRLLVVPVRVCVRLRYRSEGGGRRTERRLQCC